MSFVITNIHHTRYEELEKQITQGMSQSVAETVSKICQHCTPASPLLCVDLCELWQLKNKYTHLFQPFKPQPYLNTIVRNIVNPRRLTILALLHRKPASFNQIKKRLMQRHYPHSVNIIRDTYLQPLLASHMITNQSDLYTLSQFGKKLFDIISYTKLTPVLLSVRGAEEDIIGLLSSGPKTSRELSTAIPQTALNRHLKHLCIKGLIKKAPSTGEIHYYATKKRATRQLSPMETRIFNAVRREMLSVRDICTVEQVSDRQAYQALQRLLLIQHVRTINKEEKYYLTDTGQDVAQAYQLLYTLLKAS